MNPDRGDNDDDQLPSPDRARPWRRRVECDERGRWRRGARRRRERRSDRQRRRRPARHGARRVTRPDRTGERTR
ncbi:hypothetical protein FVP77_07890 [Microbacterium hatanonis]|uniref:Uncharacterized protein n=1 Tax=Microbacterium hatanonis TaxID=404366 RepID=A0A5C8I4V3_9MICO|nr:hypothetical protein FVP77_07890 [Microbacterium hatanonis]